MNIFKRILLPVFVFVSFQVYAQGKKERIFICKSNLYEDEHTSDAKFNNLVDNAVKYARDNTPPHIRLSTQSGSKFFTLRIEDNGIGMNRDTVKRIFERFYRAHTGNMHNVKGFGLGLSYVKTMVEAHHGEIRAESTLGKGSVFTIDIPLKRG